MLGNRSLLFAAVAVAASVVLSPAATLVSRADGPSARYAAPGTTVGRGPNATVADEGFVVCDADDGVGAGGFCLPFGGGDAVKVVDDSIGEDVAFQVCVDNSGDGICTSPDTSPTCPDVILFSHDDSGAFYNPVGPVPTGFASGCGNPSLWNGYIVFICNGVHATGTPHAHEATTGTGTLTSGGEGNGTFCGGDPVVSRKPYRQQQPPKNHPCTTSSQTDPTAEAGTQTGVLYGRASGVEALGNPSASFTLTCRVQVNVSTHTGSGPQVQGHGTGYVTAGPAQISYTTSSGTDPVYICAEVTDDADGTTYYLDGTSSVWSTSNVVDCGLTSRVGSGYSSG